MLLGFVFYLHELKQIRLKYSAEAVDNYRLRMRIYWGMFFYVDFQKAASIYNFKLAVCELSDIAACLLSNKLSERCP